MSTKTHSQLHSCAKTLLTSLITFFFFFLQTVQVMDQRTVTSPSRSVKPQKSVEPKVTTTLEKDHKITDKAHEGSDDNFPKH